MAGVPRVGVINWDACLTSDTYFGGYATRSLGCDRYEERIPFYACTDGYEFGEITLDRVETELRFASDAGVDFFAYCWYPDGNGVGNIGLEMHENIAPYLPELNRVRKLYQECERKYGVNMSAVIICQHAYSDRDFYELALAMTQDYYEKKNGRPIVYFFGGYCTEYFDAVRRAATTVGLTPYVIFMNNGRASENGDYSEADAVSAYACCAEDVDSFEGLCAATEEANVDRRKYGVPVIPLFSAGWDPSPRIDSPVPWIRYRSCRYAPRPTSEQMERSFAAFLSWCGENGDWLEGEYCTVFAWNEFEEGGYLCPTRGSDGKTDASVLLGFRRAINKFK